MRYVLIFALDDHLSKGSIAIQVGEGVRGGLLAPEEGYSSRDHL